MPVSLENGSNAGPSGVSQTSEGQGSAIQPARSLQEEESAFSAAEEVAGPAQYRRGMEALGRQGRGNRDGPDRLRPTASMVSTAVRRNGRGSPPSPPHHHAQSPKTYRTNSVVSQSIPVNSVAPTPGSVYGQMNAAAGHLPTQSRHGVASGAGQVDMQHPASIGVGTSQQPSNPYSQMQPHAFMQPNMALSNGVPYNALASLPLAPNALAGQAPLLHLPPMTAAAAAMLMPGQQASTSPTLLLQAHPYTAGSTGGAGPSNPAAAIPLTSANANPVVSAWAALHQLGLMQQLVLGSSQALLPPSPMQVQDGAAVMAVGSHAAASVSAIGLIMPGLAAGTSASLQQEAAVSDPEVVGAGHSKASAGIAAAAAAAATAAAVGLHLIPQGSSAADALDPPQPGGTGAVLSPALHAPMPQPGHSRVGSVPGHSHPPVGQQIPSRPDLVSPALSLVCPAAPCPSGGAAAAADTQGASVSVPNNALMEMGGFSMAQPSASRLHAHGGRNHHHHHQTGLNGVMGPGLPSQMSAHRHHNNNHPHDTHHGGILPEPRGHLNGSVPEPAPAVSFVGEHAAAAQGPHVAASSHHVVAAGGRGGGGGSVSRAGHTRPAASDSCVTQQQGTGLHGSALRPPSRLATRPSGLHGEADGDNDACDDNEGVLASSGAGQMGMTPAQPVGSAVAGVQQQPSGAQHELGGLLSTADNLLGQRRSNTGAGKAGETLNAAGSTAVGSEHMPLEQQPDAGPGQSVFGGDALVPAAMPHQYHHRRQSSAGDPHEAVSQAAASVLAQASRPSLSQQGGSVRVGGPGAGDGLRGEAGGPAGDDARWRGDPGGGQPTSPAHQWEEADTRSVDGVAQGAPDDGGHDMAGPGAGWHAEVAGAAHMSDAEVDGGVVASQAAREHDGSRVRNSSSRSHLSGSASGSAGGSGGGPGAPGGGAMSAGCHLRDESPGMAAALGMAEPAVAMIVGEGPLTEGDPSVSDAEAGGGRQADSGGDDRLGHHHHHHHGQGSCEDVGNSKYGGGVGVDVDRSPSSSLAHATRPAGSLMTATAGNAGAVSAAAAAAMLALGMPLAHSGGGGADGDRLEGASSQRAWQQGSADPRDQEMCGGGSDRGEAVEEGREREGGRPQGSHPGQLGVSYQNACHPATSVHAMVITHDPPEVEVAWQQHSAASHQGLNVGGGPACSPSPPPHSLPPAQRLSGSHGMAVGEGGHAQGQGPDSSMAMATAGPSTRSATISGGAGAPSQSNTVELSWRADSQMAEASQSSSGDSPVSHGAEAGGVQLSTERAYSVERASRSHVEALNPALAVAHGAAGGDSDMDDEGAGPQHALDLGSPMAGSVAGGSTLLAGPDTPTAAEPFNPTDAAAAAFSTLSNGHLHMGTGAGASFGGVGGAGASVGVVAGMPGVVSNLQAVAAALLSTHQVGGDGGVQQGSVNPSQHLHNQQAPQGQPSEQQLESNMHEQQQHHHAYANGVHNAYQVHVDLAAAQAAVSAAAHSSKSPNHHMNGQTHSTGRGSGSSINGSQRPSKRKRFDVLSETP